MSIAVELGSQLNSIPRELLLVGHCLTAAKIFSRTKDKFLLNYWTGFLAAFGGGITSGLLLQDPNVPISLFSVNAIFVIWTVCWWIINYAPYNLGPRIYSLPPIRIVAKACLNILRTTTMVTRVDSAVARYPGNIAAPLIIGSLGGNGGKFISDAVLITAGLSPGPSELAVPGWSWRSASAAASLHLVLAHHSSWYSPAEAHATLTFLFVVHSVLSDIWGRPLDFTAPIAATVTRLLNIPSENPAGHEIEPSKKRD